MEGALEGVPGVKKVFIDFGRATVRYEKGKVSLKQLIKALKEAGYGAAILEEALLKVEMECGPDCLKDVEAVLLKISGVKSIYQDLDKEGVIGVEWEKGKLTPKEILKALKEKGFRARILEEGE